MNLNKGFNKDKNKYKKIYIYDTKELKLKERVAPCFQTKVKTVQTKIIKTIIMEK